MPKTYTFLFRNMIDDDDRHIVIGAQNFMHAVKLFSERNKIICFDVRKDAYIVETENGDYIAVKIK